MPVPEIGQPAPNVTLRTIENEFVNLATSWESGQNALLIFLRHLA